MWKGCEREFCLTNQTGKIMFYLALIALTSAKVPYRDAGIGVT
jgi:hypothetical protein